jgi:hypothetical protein
MTHRFKRLAGYVEGVVSSDRASVSLLVSTLVIILFYRIQLTYLLYSSPLKPFDFSSLHHPAWFTLKFLPGDFSVALVLFIVFLSVCGSVRLFGKRKSVRALLELFVCILIQFLLVVLVLVHGLHGRLLFEGQTGLEWEVIREGLASVSLAVIVALMTFKDFLFILLPIFIFWLVFLFPAFVRRWLIGISFGFMAAGLVVASFAPAEEEGNRQEAPVEIRRNPAAFFFSDLAARILEKTGEILRVPAPGHNRPDAKGRGSAEGGPTAPLKFLPPKSAEPWNVLVFVMESVGTRYIFDTSGGSPMPMPFLYSLSRRGWYLKRHFTTANLSTKALFSLMSGLYDSFRHESLGLRPEAAIPTLFHLVPPHYETFLVTPVPMTWFFPSELIRNSGPSEIHSYENLGLNVRQEFHPSLGRYVARDEVQTVDFLIQRLSRAKEPFLGVYISYVAHFPYFDYGPEFRVRDNDGPLINHYLNNLNLLDRLIERVYDQLKKEGKLERTIFVIVGDHGQAFGQHHPNNFMHFRYSYNENLECPAILFQPTLFPPRVIDFPTSHVDLLPTLLDAMRVPYPAAVFDGESLFEQRPKRKYLYFSGHEGSISSLGTDLVKVQVSLKKDRCWAFDLKSDPDENTLLDCSSFKEQVEGLQEFVRRHDEGLSEYNASVREQRDLQGFRLLP